MATRSPSLTLEPLGMSLVRVMGPPWLQIWGTRILEERTASTMPATRTSRLARGVSGGAAWVTGGVEGEQAARRRSGMATDSDDVMGIVSAIRRRKWGKCLAELRVFFCVKVRHGMGGDSTLRTQRKAF